MWPLLFAVLVERVSVIILTTKKSWCKNLTCMPKKKSTQPRLFIASSKEGLDYAYAIQKNLDDDADVTVWTQGIFDLSATTVESLIGALDKFDFAIFVFAPDDVLRIRQRKFVAVRDNVVFELGLFMGKLGRDRTFIVVPKSSDLRIPTDLAGITPGKFNPERNDGNLSAALGAFCNDVRLQIRTGKRISLKTRSAKTTKKGGRGAPKESLFVNTAFYGSGDHRVDVTSQLRAAVKDGKLHIYAGNQIAGDPTPNTPKELTVTYATEKGGFVLGKVVPEGQTLDLP